MKKKMLSLTISLAFAAQVFAESPTTVDSFMNDTTAELSAYSGNFAISSDEEAITINFWGDVPENEIERIATEKYTDAQALGMHLRVNLLDASNLEKVLGQYYDGSETIEFQSAGRVSDENPENAGEPEKKSDNKETQGNPEESEDSKEPTVDKIKNYVGRNAASFGYYSLGGDRIDNSYGDRLDTLDLILVSDDGHYIDISDDDDLKKYVVIKQSIEPDSEIIFYYNEYGMVDHQTYNEIELLCEKASGETESPVLTDLTKINGSPDKSTQYVKEYVGRNLAMVGYEGLDGDWHDRYNGTFNTVDIVVITDDGSYIEPDDLEMKKQYIVTQQNPEPNSEFIFNYDEYGLVESQTYNEIELYVSKIN